VNAVIGAGLHALVEKPFAENASDTARLLSSAEGGGVIVCPVHQFLFQDGVRRIIAWLPSLGHIQRVEFSTCSAGATGTDPASLDDLIAEILPHPLALVSTLLGASLGAASWQITHPVAGELRAVTAVGETIVSIAISAHSRPTENVLRVLGSAGSATADLFHGFAVRHDGAVSRRAKVAQPFVAAGMTLGGASANLVRRALRAESAYPGLRELVRQFYQAIRHGWPAPVSRASTTDVACARDRIISSLRVRPAS
jgi:predicted dehydrogenase